MIINPVELHIDDVLEALLVVGWIKKKVKLFDKYQGKIQYKN